MGEDTARVRPRVRTRAWGKNNWRYAILIGRSFYTFLQQGLLKSYGVLIPAMMIEMNTSTSVVGIIASLQHTIAYAACPLVQQMLRVARPKVVATAGGTLVCLAIMGTYAATQPLHFSLLFCVAGFGAAMFSHTSNVELKEHFGDQYGSANSFCLTMAVVGGMVMPFMTQRIFEAFGMRGTLMVLSAIAAHLIPAGLAIRLSNRESKATDGMILETSPETDEDIIRTVTPKDHALRRQECARDCLKTCLYPVRVILAGFAKVFAVGTIKKELPIVMCLVIEQLLLDTVFFSWVLFAVSYAISVGIDQSMAPYVLVSGSIGGLASRLLFILVLRLRPKWGPYLYAGCLVTFLIPLFLIQVSSSFASLLAIAFVLGTGLYGWHVPFFATIGIYTSPESFPDIMALSFFFTGVSIPMGGGITGYIFDVTQSFSTVFMISGGLVVFSFTMSLIYIVVLKRKNTASVSVTI